MITEIAKPSIPNTPRLAQWRLSMKEMDDAWERSQRRFYDSDTLVLYGAGSNIVTTELSGAAAYDTVTFETNSQSLLAYW